eukprot:494789-Amorphochlora_amoeboformis.AAC.1
MGVTKSGKRKSRANVRTGLGLGLGSDQTIQHVLVRGPLTPPQCGEIVLFGITVDRVVGGVRVRVRGEVGFGLGNVLLSTRTLEQLLFDV